MKKPPQQEKHQVTLPNGLFQFRYFAKLLKASKKEKWRPHWKNQKTSYAGHPVGFSQAASTLIAYC